jgi:hypothetical protein
MTSCLNEFLDVTPKTDIATVNFWKTSSDARSALNAAYAELQLCMVDNGGYNYAYLFEARSDNFIGNNLLATPLVSANFNFLTSTHPGSNWNHYYKMISITNYALYYLPKMTSISEIQRDHFLSEAYFLRAYSYFTLVRLWGDVPKITEPVLAVTDVTKPFKASKDTILSLISSDLKLSLQKVDETAANVYLFNAGALYALYTDFSMWIHDYDNAVLYSQKLYDISRFKLVAGVDFSTVCSNGATTENIWTLKWNFANNSYNTAIYMLNGQGQNVIITARPLRNLWARPEWSTDIRRSQTIDITYNYAYNHIDNLDSRGSIWKWTPTIRLNKTTEVPVPLYRLADIILLRAEALNKLGRTADALAELKKVRDRAGLAEKKIDEFSILTDKQRMDSVENIILQERQFELIGEGKRWFDLVRTGKAMSTMNNFFSTYIEKSSNQKPSHFTDEWQLYWPVYFNNIQENENISQTGNY